jgi:hypothetical protein
MKGIGALVKTLPIQMVFFNLGQVIARRRPHLAFGVCAIKNLREE